MNEPIKKPCYCLGRNTILQVATEGQLQTDHVDFVAADDLFHQDPYVQIAKLTKELDELRGKLDALKTIHDDALKSMDQLAAKCAEMGSVLEAVLEVVDLLDYDETRYWTNTITHALSDQCGTGWTSPEKTKVLVEALREATEFCEHEDPHADLLTRMIRLRDKAKQALEASK